MVSTAYKGRTDSQIVQSLNDLFNNPVEQLTEKEVKMILSKAGTFKTLRFLGIFCAIVMGFMTLVGTSEDDAKDIVDVDFDANATFELDPITVDQSVNTLSIQAAGEANCGSLTINEALAAVEDEIEDLDQVDIDDVELRFVEGTYTANWLPDTVASFSCSLTISGSQPTITIAETAINGTEGPLNDILTEEQIGVINYYLSNRNEAFSYCVTCDDVELDSYSVTYNVDIEVTISGTI